MPIQDSNAGEVMPPIKALLLDDSAFDRSRIRRMTEKSDIPMMIEEVPTIAALSQVMDRDVFDLIMIDYQLAEGDGLEALDLIQNHATNRGAATIMISGQEHMEVAVSAFRNGCHDFITKDELTLPMLRDAMQSALQNASIAMLRGPQIAQEIQKQVQQAMRSTLESGVMQSALTEGLRQAADRIGLEVAGKGTEEMDAFLTEFVADDRFYF